MDRRRLARSEPLYPESSDRHVMPLPLQLCLLFLHCKHRLLFSIVIDLFSDTIHTYG